MRLWKSVLNHIMCWLGIAKQDSGAGEERRPPGLFAPVLVQRSSGAANCRAGHRQVRQCTTWARWTHYV